MGCREWVLFSPGISLGRQLGLSLKQAIFLLEWHAFFLNSEQYLWSVLLPEKC